MKKLLLILLFFSSCSQYTSVIKYGFPKDPYTQKKSKSFNELKKLGKMVK